MEGTASTYSWRLQGRLVRRAELFDESDWMAHLRVRAVEYNPRIPIETFDFIVTDECHRSIYNLWRQVLDYFDSFIIGLNSMTRLRWKKPMVCGE